MGHPVSSLALRFHRLYCLGCARNCGVAGGSGFGPLRAGLPEYKEIFREVEVDMRRRVEEIVTERESGHDVIPIVQYADVASGKVPAELMGKIKARGACVVRETFSKEPVVRCRDVS